MNDNPDGQSVDGTLLAACALLVSALLSWSVHALDLVRSELYGPPGWRVLLPAAAVAALVLAGRSGRTPRLLPWAGLAGAVAAVCALGAALSGAVEPAPAYGGTPGAAGAFCCLAFAVAVAVLGLRGSLRWARPGARESWVFLVALCGAALCMVPWWRIELGAGGVVRPQAVSGGGALVLAGALTVAAASGWAALRRERLPGWTVVPAFLALAACGLPPWSGRGTDLEPLPALWAAAAAQVLLLILVMQARAAFPGGWSSPAVAAGLLLAAAPFLPERGRHYVIDATGGRLFLGQVVVAAGVTAALLAWTGRERLIPVPALVALAAGAADIVRCNVGDWTPAGGTGPSFRLAGTLIFALALLLLLPARVNRMTRVRAEPLAAVATAHGPAVPIPEADENLVAGRYRLRERLGAGGMGAVWRATDELLRQDVAVKEVLLPLDQPRHEQMLTRALREARALAGLRAHPAIVTVHDVVVHRGRPWMIMELVEGRSLAELVARDGPLPDTRCARLALILLDALEAAHRSGVLHRDVKPGNVLLATDGRVVLADFGIASRPDETSMTLIGSPGYIAPERLRGDHDDERSDLWSFGATLYYAVEGRPAFPGALPAAVLTSAPHPPRLAPRLAPLLAGLLDPDPMTRWTGPRARAALLAAVR